VKRIQGQHDTHLTQKGLQQAKTLHDKLQGVDFDAVFCSPLSRAKDTCKIILGNRAVETVYDPCLMERDFGELVGRVDNFMRFWQTQIPCHAKGVESIADMEKRIFPFMEKIVKDYKDKNVLIVAHQGTLFIIENFFGNAPKDGDYKPLRLEGCGYRVYDPKTMKKVDQQGQNDTGLSG
jgi:probable phosphoglycerate mutase